MRVTEMLLQKHKQKQNKNNEEEAEETQCYKKQNIEQWLLNQSKTVFQSPFDDGLNTKSNIFDKQAIFQTKEE